MTRQPYKVEVIQTSTATIDVMAEDPEEARAQAKLLADDLSSDEWTSGSIEAEDAEVSTPDPHDVIFDPDRRDWFDWKDIVP